MRDRETIDSELRRLATERQFFREHGDELSISELDDLLDERLGHRPEPRVGTAVQTRKPVVVVGNRPPRRRRGVLRRVAVRAVIPLSIAAVAGVLVVMLALHYHRPASGPAAMPQSDEQPHAPAALPPAPPVKTTTPQDIADTALMDVLQHENVPTPSREYVTSQGHAVCDFLRHQADVTEAAHFVQRSSIWDADQSAEVASAAVADYCPQYATAGSEKVEQAIQSSQSSLKDIEGDLQGINNDLQDIRDGLPGGN
jgi:hypothetical protein